MFKGFDADALSFMQGIRKNNNKQWFEENKKTYIDKVYHPMKELCKELFVPFAEDATMMAKAGRIYRDEFFPPYLKYREEMWIIIKHEAFHWNRTPSLFFELSGDGATFGLKIPKPEAGVMELFRQKLIQSPDYFLSLVKILEEDFGITVGGDEYKRAKPGAFEGAERFFKKKGLTFYVTVKSKRELYSRKILEHTAMVFDALFPLNEFFHELVGEYEVHKAKQLIESTTEPQPEMPKAPVNDFMW